MEQIYTIPVNEAFDAAPVAVLPEDAKATEESSSLCPLCRLYDKLNDQELTRILGAAMMEPDVRIETNKHGFCGPHYRAMFRRKNRLGLALMMESHLGCLEKELKDGLISSTIQGAGRKPLKRMAELESDCYICGRIDDHFSRMLDTVIYLYRSDETFRKKMANQTCYCLPHFRRLAERAGQKMPRKEFSDFYRLIEITEKKYLAALSEDVSWFCKKFDYRYENEPWKNSKDAVERTIGFLRGSGEALK